MSSPDADGPIPTHPFRNGGSLPSTVLSRNHIMEALSKSPDNGATLDLAHKDLTDVGESGAEELANVVQEAETDIVIRIALAYNRLTTLPMAFALLSRLRYLVLRNNSFSVFPDVLTVMPSLEILDISRNKIKRFPSQPGCLVNLRVFSVFRNKIRRLPAYIPQFSQLTIFKVDQNPIEWPPKSILESRGNLDDPQVMAEWIKNVQTWIEDNCPSPSSRKMSEDSMETEQSLQDASDISIEQDSNSVPPSPPPKDGLRATTLYHARSFSLESDTSTYFQLDRSPRSTGSSRSRDGRPNWPPNLKLTPSAPSLATSSSTSPARSPDSYYPSDESAPSTNGDGSGSGNGGQLMETINNGADSPAGYRPVSNSSSITVKKSLPELRLKNLHLATREDRHDSQQRSATQSAQSSAISSPHRPVFAPETPLTASPVKMDRPARPMDNERHSYFRRLSSLTPLSLAKTIPEDLLALVDAVRGVLFGVSQIYQALQHYTVYAIDERLSAVLLKVLDPASVYMSQLIDALDRFDTMSKKALPPPAVCRAVVESCRDNVTVFGKAVGVLALQLKVLATHDDVRYTRSMLLTLYGAMAEISSSWQSMSSRIEAVRPLLWEVRPPPVAKSHTRPNGTEFAGRSPVSAPAGGPSSFIGSLDQPRLRPNVSPGSLDHGKTRMTRRHAGSFSSKDVEIGKMLPSFVDPPSLTAGVLNGASPLTPVPRTMRRVGPSLNSAPLNGASTVNSSGPQSADGSFAGAGGTAQANHRWDSHSRQGSQSSMVASSSSSSLALRMALDTPSSTSTLVDKEAIEAMKQALDAAPAIWEMMGEILSDELDSKEDLKETLDKAKDVAERLRQNIQTMQDGSPLADRKPLHDDARVFAKTVIQLSSAIKTHITAHPLSSTIRTDMVKLTNATEEFVILLHVSSFSPAPTPRPYSPMVAHPSPLGPHEDGKLGANLSRTRSAAPSSSSKLATTMREPPHTALPHQTFAIPTPPRFGPLRKEITNDSAAVPG